MRATIETHDNSNNLPPIQVLVSLGDEDVSIKVGCKSQLLEIVIFVKTERLNNAYGIQSLSFRNVIASRWVSALKWPGGVGVKGNVGVFLCVEALCEPARLTT